MEHGWRVHCSSRGTHTHSNTNNLRNFRERLPHRVGTGTDGGNGGGQQFSIAEVWAPVIFLWRFAELGACLQNIVASRACASFSNGVASRPIAFLSTKKIRVISLSRHRVSKITSRCFRIRNFRACNFCACPSLGFLSTL